jgi:hypothetical protein
MSGSRARSKLESREWEMIELFPTTDNKTLSEMFGTSLSTIERWARGLDLRKDVAYIKRIQTERSIGRILSEESKDKIRKKAIGRVVSEESKKKSAETKRKNGSVPKGENHYHWKGGKPWMRFKNPEYQKWRKRVLERDGYICQDCGRQCKKREKGLAAHHLKSYTKYPKLRFEVSNGLTLCRRCHMTRHGKTVPPVKQILCACGCGTLTNSRDIQGRPRKYVYGHFKRTSSKNSVIFEGKNRKLNELIKEFKVCPRLVYERLRRGWDIVDTLTKPKDLRCILLKR